VSEYVAEGRYFQAIELHEGPEMTKYVMSQIPADILMFSTDYPHGESRYPEAVAEFMGWDPLTSEEKRRILWDNAMRCFPRAAA
jgi:predicted TIM-barrel fold metal-dependent hydrolase